MTIAKLALAINGQFPIGARVEIGDKLFRYPSKTAEDMMLLAYNSLLSGGYTEAKKHVHQAVGIDNVAENSGAEALDRKMIYKNFEISFPAIVLSEPELQVQFNRNSPE